MKLDATHGSGPGVRRKDVHEAVPGSFTVLAVAGALSPGQLPPAATEPRADAGEGPRGVPSPLQMAVTFAGHVRALAPAPIDAPSHDGRAPRVASFDPGSLRMHADGRRSGTARIVLDHPSLGTIELELVASGREMVVRATTSDPSATALLRAHESGLRASLAAGGVQLRGMWVETRPDARRTIRERRRRRRPPNEEA